MSIGARPRVVVSPPDPRGLREVTAGSRTLGRVWSCRGLRRLLHRAGYPRAMPLTDPRFVSWHGGGSTTWPDRPWHRRTAAALMAAGLLCSAALLVSIGQVDAAGAQTFAGRLTGWLLILAGAVQTAAAAAATDFWGRRRLSWSGPLVLVGALIALAMSALLLGMWCEAREYIVQLPLYAALFCWALWALWLLVRHAAWKGLPHPRSIVAGLTLSAVLTGVNFSQTTLYEPNAERSIVTAEAKLGEPRVSPDGKVLHLSLRLSVKNVGKVPVDVLGTIFWVIGQTSRVYQAGRPEFWRRELPGEEDAERYARATGREQLAFGIFMKDGSWLDPGTEKAEEKIVQLPAGTDYSTVEAVAKVITSRRDRGRIGAEYPVNWYSWQQFPPCDPQYFDRPHTGWFAVRDALPRALAEEWSCRLRGAPWCPLRGRPRCDTDILLSTARIRHNNNLINVTRGARYVTLVRLVDRTASNPDIQAVIAPAPGGRVLLPPDHEESPERYGLMRTVSDVARVPSTALVSPRSEADPEP
ncbi:hypothetical protein OOK31_28570 [Streptomyces sp. NBC_00249]|uniref:hypothetical protein n=1 Tax=Streptomyces sp. NBC_00249 TaxID=2975690 RepID=UPI00224DA788|nr:hypothetical protein [Streptomyces sp. NBC_00249]MCX5197803.1 hypothetical protein [Streptomyces sp. NBC_00249]